METNSNTETHADPAPEMAAAVAAASGGDTAEVRHETVMVKIGEIFPRDTGAIWEICKRWPS